MARLSQTTQLPDGYKLAPTLTAANVDGDIIDSGQVRLWVTNGSGASISVTVQATGIVDDLPLTNLVVAVAAGATALIGPFPKRAFGRPTGDDKGRVYVDYSAVTTVTRAVVAP